ncbi:MAG: hypothetical protein AVDCRST_MAG88-325 [uncultured Thermomicrobiales bacterium]|uniref:Uncharacterized protein n=1 Tax=uncultured Thermomicrobiales bacterium TaxID=1645740 RepID=A0A6J4UAU5_9BACT|nr:MAG: hypothetical protein AVDCRST_MAG88-325 [uncultured Thermomicrobiales bacterium]
MAIEPPRVPRPLPPLLAYRQSLHPEPQLRRPKRGLPTFVLAWRGNDQPQLLEQFDEGGCRAASAWRGHATRRASNDRSCERGQK